MKEPIGGTCCSCGDTGPEETECLKRKDKTHCNHWWDGTDEENPKEDRDE